MLENILFAVLCAIVIAAAVFAWWFERHDSKTKPENETEKR